MGELNKGCWCVWDTDGVSVDPPVFVRLLFVPFEWCSVLWWWCPAHGSSSKFGSWIYSCHLSGPLGHNCSILSVIFGRRLTAQCASVPLWLDFQLMIQ